MRILLGKDSKVVITGAIRTPIGKYAGIFKEVRPDDLAAIAIGSLVSRTGIDTKLIDDIYIGCANQAGEDNRNVARMAALLAGLPYSVPAATVNRLCGSGLEAINDAARVIATGEGDVLVAGGVESMTRAPLVMQKADRGFRRGELTLADSTMGWRLVNPRWPLQYPPISLGETAENLAESSKSGREEQDEFALSSHKKAIAAIDQKKFEDEIIPVPTREYPDGVMTDEGPRRDTSMEKLKKLQPVFKEGGTVTAGNSSGISDGAAALLMMSEAKADSLSMKPIVRILGSATAGVHPSFMGIGPVPATMKLLNRLGMTLDEFGVIEINEAFAAQVLACLKELPEIRTDKLNPNGGAIALGHPLGCSGSRITVTLISEMKRRNARYGLATMCIGVGQGIATVFELVK